MVTEAYAFNINTIQQWKVHVLQYITVYRILRFFVFKLLGKPLEHDKQKYVLLVTIKRMIQTK